MRRAIFYFEKLKPREKWIVCLHVFFTLVLWYYFANISSGSKNEHLLMAYPLATQLFLYFFYYKALRNLTVYLLWIGIGLLHLAVYLNFSFGLSGSHMYVTFRNTIILVILFQLLRIVSLKIQGKELVCPSKIGNRDLYDDRKISFPDFLLFAVYICTTFLLSAF